MRKPDENTLHSSFTRPISGLTHFIMPKSPYHSLQTRTRGIHLTGGKHSSMARAVGEAGRAEENERVGALGIVFRLLGSDGPTAQSDGQASCPAGVPRGRGSGSSALGSGGGGALLVFLAWAPSSPHFLALSWARGQVLFSLTCRRGDDR